MTSTTKVTKKSYEQPKLVAFGSVRNLTGGSLEVGSDAPLAGNMNRRSDRRAKENIVQVDTHPAGFGLYLFDYKDEFQAEGTGRQFGVMADEVAPIFPEAVSYDDTGYARVNYSVLGITRH